ncbi:MAG TPA: hypothetical protein HA254_01365, partial [Candidatus Diapherotrites archaeon]|nr:hypothetical protein [Candidatus Diapherotrites archaeon]
MQSKKFPLKAAIFVLLAIAISAVLVLMPHTREQNTGLLPLSGAGSGLVGWWQFDEGSGPTAVDSSGYGNNGIMIGSPTWVDGISGKALNFNGTTDYIRIPQSDSLRSGAKTIAMWANVSDLYKLSGAVFSWGWTGCTDTYAGFVRSDGSFIVYYQNSAGAIIRSITIAGPGTWKPGEWAHWAIVYNSSGSTVTISLYKNGAPAGTPYTGSDGLSPACAMRVIGSQEDYPNPRYVRTFSGMLDDYRVYNRALSASDILDLYSQTKPSLTDTTAPTVPAGLTASAVSATRIDLSWSASTDDTAVAGYVIYRGSSPIAAVRSGTTYSDVNHGATTVFFYNLLPSTAYSYSVAAFDAAGNYSTRSATASATTPAAAGGGPYNLSVTLTGTSTGRIESSTGGIGCTSGTGTCSANYPAGTTVVLTPYAFGAPNNTSFSDNFRGWSGAGCTGNGECFVTMTGDTSVTASYGSSSPPPTSYTLTVSHSGSGSGTITSSPSGISCPSGTCSGSFSSGTSITLTATPASGSAFGGWSGGGCSGTGTCPVSLGSATTVTANFTTTPTADTTAPSVPAGLSATAISPSQINLSWTASTDTVGVTGYNIYRCAGSGCTPALLTTTTTNSYSGTALTASTSYTYRVAAYDAAGNTSAQSGPSSATTSSGSTAPVHYIRAGATGLNNGTSWENAWTSFAAVAAAGTSGWRRGDTYYIASGIYNENVSISRAESGTSRISIKKATIADHGPAADWSDFYASGQAEIDGTLVILNSYIDFDGVTGSDDSGYGIRIYYNKCDTAESPTVAIVSLGRGKDSIHLRHLDIRGCGYATYDRVGGFVQSGDNTEPDYSGTNPVNPSYDIEITDSWIHEVSVNGLTIGGHIGTSYERGSLGFLLENTRVERTGGTMYAYPNWHGQGMQIGYSATQDYIVLRNNKFIDMNGTGYIAVLGKSVNNHFRIYNNLFYSTDRNEFKASPGVITFLAYNIPVNNVQIYNNTFYNIDLKGITNGMPPSAPNPGSNNELKNNLFVNSRFTYGNVGFTTQNNDYYGNDGVGVPKGEQGQQGEAADPFVNSAGYDFRLKSTANAKDNGVNLGSIFSADVIGVSRPQGSGWDIGAYEYNLGQSANQSPAVSITSPSSGQTFSAPAAITISANASDSDGTVSRVEFFSGSSSLGTDTASPYSYAWSAVTAGTYSITARATDNDGATATSGAVNITVGTPLPMVTIAASDPAASEAGPAAGAFTITRTGPTTSALTVNYSMSGTATNMIDYAVLSGTVTIPAGSASATFTLTPINDSITEGPENATATLSTNPNYTVGALSFATLLIADNETMPQTDDDSDGVPNVIDKCPKTAGTSRNYVNVFGCAMPIATKFDIKPDFNATD